ncbi:MAG: outer membrane beta-barrel protein [Desulfococcaceae bacterium]
MMKRCTCFSVVSALLCSFLLLFSQTEVKADDYMGYAVFKGGYYGPQEEFGDDEEELDGQDYWELAFGMDLGIIGLELGAGYMQADNDRADVTIIPVLGTARLQLPITIFCPYLEAGVGAYFTDIEIRDYDNDTEANFGVHAGVGADVRIERFLFGIEARYLWVEAELEDSDTEIDFDGFTVTGNIGIRF